MKNYARLLAFLLCAVSTSSAFAQLDSDFAKANQDYAQGNFNEAISGYRTLVGSGQWSANLFYDLGNAYFRTGDFGRAILNYERALALERHHPEATANLQIARDEARALEIVTGQDVQARLATADTANSVLALPPGSEVKILSTRGDWVYAVLPNKLRGWIPVKRTELVRL